MNTQFLTDSKGDKVAVVIPINEYEDLMEDVADLACVAERRDDERISLADLKSSLQAIIRGKNPVGVVGSPSATAERRNYE